MNKVFTRLTTLLLFISVPCICLSDAVAQPVQIYPQYDATLHISVKGASPETGALLLDVFGNNADNSSSPIMSNPSIVNIGQMAQKQHSSQMEVGIFNFTLSEVLGGHMYSCLSVPSSNLSKINCNNVGLDTTRDSYDVIVDVTGLKE